ncbi:MAG: DUF3109 family protein [Bacteroidales bacterium]|nr:DUF3109 family protein [Bacteroidales bacterium]
MIIIDDTLVSENLRKVHFICDLGKCHGDCCVEGDAGAPLEEDEISILEDVVEEVKPYMTPEGLAVVEKNGVFDYDIDGSYVTPLVNDRECAFVYFENGISFCAIEKAWSEGKIDFKKPISCHLYPVRLQELASDTTAVNYDQWDICKAALLKGKEEQVPVYQFLKEPLIRKFGEEWYKKLTVAFENEQD